VKKEWETLSSVRKGPFCKIIKEGGEKKISDKTGVRAGTQQIHQEDRNVHYRGRETSKILGKGGILKEPNKERLKRGLLGGSRFFRRKEPRTDLEKRSREEYRAD